MFAQPHCGGRGGAGRGARGSRLGRHDVTAYLELFVQVRVHLILREVTRPVYSQQDGTTIAHTLSAT